MTPHSTGITVARWVGAVLCALAVALSLPLFMVANWVNKSIIPTDSFVTLLSPIPKSERFQSLLASAVGEEAGNAVEDAMTNAGIGDVASGIGDLLDLLPFTTDTGQTVAELPSVVSEQVAVITEVQTRNFLESPNFPPLWDTALGQIHGQLIGALNGDRALDTNAEGSAILTIEVGPLIEAVKAQLSEEGYWWAQYIPGVQVDVPIVEIVDLAQLQRYFALTEGSSILFAAIGVIAAIGAVLLAPKRLLVIGIAALMTSLVGAIFWTQAASFSDTYLRGLSNEFTAEISTAIWNLLSAPLVSALQLAVTLSAITAIGTLGAALVIYLRRPGEIAGGAEKGIPQKSQ